MRSPAGVLLWLVWGVLVWDVHRRVVFCGELSLRFPIYWNREIRACRSNSMLDGRTLEIHRMHTHEILPRRRLAEDRVVRGCRKVLRRDHIRRNFGGQCLDRVLVAGVGVRAYCGQGLRATGGSCRATSMRSKAQRQMLSRRNLHCGLHRNRGLDWECQGWDTRIGITKLAMELNNFVLRAAKGSGARWC